ncbi:c-type cytochrome [Marinobacter sp. C2H3]|uniref:c-type cytochrome n=1 Tax=Marinobacter sp. C2H3 TaxID=3119003 RepID=UPI00300F20BE
MTLRCLRFVAAVAVLLGQAGAVSAGDAEAGKALAGARCAACHGQNGISAIPVYPSLAGQNEAYLVSALKAYRSGQRAGGQAAIMQGQAASLTDEQIDNLAAYFAKLPAGGGQ